MDYVPSTDRELREMLGVIGVADFRDLIAEIPSSLLDPDLGWPAGFSELELRDHVESLAARQRDDRVLFCGAGAYDHFIPAVVDAVAGRSEFVTAYTPYQAEASQGTLQAIYEYQSMICAITGMDVANASLYDGASAAAEAVIMAWHATKKRNAVLVSRGLHPHAAATLRTYLRGTETTIVDLPLEDGATDPAAVRELASGHEAAAVIVQSPNFYGCIEDVGGVAEAAHDAGTLAAVGANPIALGLLRPPGELGADIVFGEGQPLGLPLVYGGPYLGYLACRRQHLHKMPGRIAGRTIDTQGREGFVLTFQAREQHIRREKATSNICTNQALMALRACVYLAAVGRDGFGEVARLNYALAHEAATMLTAIAGCELAHPRPFFNEFALRFDRPRPRVEASCRDAGIVPGVFTEDLLPGEPPLLLVAVTEKRTRDEIRRLAEAIDRA